MTALQVTHRAIVNKTSVYQKNIFDLSKMKLGTPNAYPHKVLKNSKNKKLGPKVTKGKLSGLPIKTLTLVERESCSEDCLHYLDCYGNSMPFAYRFSSNLGLLSVPAPFPTFKGIPRIGQYLGTFGRLL